MAEVLMRRYGKKTASLPDPDMLMLDGGKGQLNIAISVLKELGLELVYVIDDKRKGKEWFGYKVIGMVDFVESNADVLILATFVKEEIDSFCKAQEGIRVVTLRE